MGLHLLDCCCLGTTEEAEDVILVRVELSLSGSYGPKPGSWGWNSSIGIIAHSQDFKTRKILNPWGNPSIEWVIWEIKNANEGKVSNVGRYILLCETWLKKSNTLKSVAASLQDYACFFIPLNFDKSNDT